ncbi:MAG TPA: hypothetical protein VMU07_01850 [Candidatus Paceibacterota bacterium]|nr:hypothetical protein [Candidatus Paceibacterota bacterium]
MDKISNTGKAVAVALIIVVAVAIILVYGGAKKSASNPSSSSTAVTASTDNATGTPGASTTAGTNGTSGSHTGTTVRRNPPFVIHLIAPAANGQWKIGASNSISWDKAGNITGVIDLLDAKGNFVGTILSETGTGQTSYSWDTREYALSRYSPLKKELVPGTYKIRLSFDGNNLPPLVSPVFTVTN